MIRAARLRAGMTQVELAKNAGTSQPTLARYESGTAIPSLPTLERLLAGCGRRLQLRDLPAGETRIPLTSMRGQTGELAALLRVHRSQIIRAAQRSGVRHIHVFGSVARGEEDAESDIDLLVDLASGRTLLDLVGFKQEVQDILGVPVDVATHDMLKERVLADAMPEMVPL